MTASTLQSRLRDIERNMNAATIFHAFREITRDSWDQPGVPSTLDELTDALVLWYFNWSIKNFYDSDEAPLFCGIITRRQAEIVIAEMRPELRNKLIGPLK